MCHPPSHCMCGRCFEGPWLGSGADLNGQGVPRLRQEAGERLFQGPSLQPQQPHLGGSGCALPTCCVWQLVVGWLRACVRGEALSAFDMSHMYCADMPLQGLNGTGASPSPASNTTTTASLSPSPTPSPSPQAASLPSLSPTASPAGQSPGGQGEEAGAAPGFFWNGARWVPVSSGLPPPGGAVMGVPSGGMPAGGSDGSVVTGR